MTKNNDADVDSYVVSYNKGVGDSTAPSSTTSKKYTSYTANGWSSDNNLTREYTNGQSVTNLTTTKNGTVTLYPAFSSTVNQRSVNLATAVTKNNTNLGTVTFNYNGSGAANTTSTAYNTYVFEAWYNASSGGTKIGNASASYTPTADITLYPHFTATAHSATFPTPTRTGDEFAGWYTEATGRRRRIR